MIVDCPAYPLSGVHADEQGLIFVAVELGYDFFFCCKGCWPYFFLADGFDVAEIGFFFSGCKDEFDS